MHGYTIGLFIHLVGVVGFFIAIGFVQRAGVGLRRATTVEQARLWSGLVRPPAGMFPLSLLLILGSGLYMTSDVWTFDTPWIVVAIVSVLVIGVLGGAFIDRRLAAIAHAAETAGGGSVPAGLAQRIADPGLWAAVFVSNGIALGMLWLMATKPSWVVAIAVPGGSALLGAVIGYAVARPRLRQPVAAAR